MSKVLATRGWGLKFRFPSCYEKKVSPGRAAGVCGAVQLHQWRPGPVTLSQKIRWKSATPRWSWTHYTAEGELKPFSCAHTLRAWDYSVCCRSRFVWCWGSSQGMLCYVSAVPNQPHAQPALLVDMVNCMLSILQSSAFVLRRECKRCHYSRNIVIPHTFNFIQGSKAEDFISQLPWQLNEALH